MKWFLKTINFIITKISGRKKTTKNLPSIPKDNYPMF